MRKENVLKIEERAFIQVSSIVPTTLFTAEEAGFYRITTASSAGRDSDGNPQSVGLFTTIPVGSNNDISLASNTTPSDGLGANAPGSAAVVKIGADISLYLAEGTEVQIRTDQNNPPGFLFDMHVVVEQIS